MWRPELRFYERRVAILREFEDRGELRAFRVGDDFVDARLSDRGDQLTVRQDGLTLQLLAPDADATRAWQAAAVAISAVEPSRTRRMVATFQHVVDLELAFADAVSLGYARLVAGLGDRIGDTHVADWALMADLRPGEGDSEPSGQVEFGIVRDAEVPYRLARRAGRVGREAPRTSHELWSPSDFPNVALFADSMWTIEGSDAPDDVMQEALAFWDATRTRASTLVDDLISRLKTDEDAREMRPET
jgi:hypothetical protein